MSKLKLTSLYIMMLYIQSYMLIADTVVLLTSDIVASLYFLKYLCAYLSSQVL